MILLGDIAQNTEITKWIIVICGVIFLFFGASLYYSAVRLLGSFIVAIIAVLFCYYQLQDSTASDGLKIALYVGSAFVGALLGGTIALVFHYFVFFATGAIVFLILFKMFAQNLITPDIFSNLSWELFMDLAKPEDYLQAGAMIVGGVVYMAASRFVIIITLSLVGAFLVAFAFNMYILFPVLAAVGSIFQFVLTGRRRRTRVVKTVAH